MLAERRDLTVATYSSDRGTGSRLTVWVLTGNACCEGCFASVLLHPDVASTANSTSAEHVKPITLFTVTPQLMDDAQQMLFGTRKVHQFLDLALPKGIDPASFGPQEAQGESRNPVETDPD